MPNFFFLHASTGRSWPTNDTPHRWLLAHRNDDLLAPARERLLASPDDPGRCLRVALRRCGLVLVQVVAEDKLVVEHWSDPAPELRAFAKENQLARAGIQVVFANTKNGKFVAHEDGQDVLLFGVRVGPTFPWNEYAAKYERRMIEEADDHDATSASDTNFVWAGMPAERLTWQMLKSIWNAERIACPNCDRPLLTTNFSWHQGMLSYRPAKLTRHCPGCRRRFEADEREPLAWVASVLPPTLRPTHLDQWRRFEIDWNCIALKRQRPVQVEDREE